MSKEALLKTLISAAIVLALSLAGTSGVPAGEKGAKKKSKGKGSGMVAIVFNPAGLTTQDAALTIEQDITDGLPGPVKVRSSAIGTGHWVDLPLNLPAAVSSGKGKTSPVFVAGVEVCHQEVAEEEPPPTSFIDTIRLTKLESPLGSEIEHEDETDSLSETPICIQSPVPFPFPVEAPVTLHLNLDFEKLDDVFCFTTIRVLLATQADDDLSDVSEPSEPSVPSPPSAPSEPSEPS